MSWNVSTPQITLAARVAQQAPVEQRARLAGARLVDDDLDRVDLALVEEAAATGALRAVDRVGAHHVGDPPEPRRR